MSRLFKSLLLIVCTIELCIAVPTAYGQSNSVCPLKIQSIRMSGANHQHWGWNFPNGEAALEVRYKNISTQEIVGGTIVVASPFSLKGPLPAVQHDGKLNLAIVRLQPSKKAKSDLQVFANGMSTRAWLKEVIFAGGTRWEPAQTDDCSYRMH